MALDDSDVSQTTRSRRERIRDNQRRSRARRQEHLTNLEKRLAECHTVCREADLQRAAFREMQLEIARLRELLGLAGVQNSLINAYVKQGNTLQNESAPSLRPLRPKITASDTPSSQLASDT